MSTRSTAETLPAGEGNISGDGDNRRNRQALVAGPDQILASRRNLGVDVETTDGLARYDEQLWTVSETPQRERAQATLT